VNKDSSSFAEDHLDVFDGTDDWTIPDRVAKQPYFVFIDHHEVHSLLDAFHRLDQNMKAGNMGHLVSRKQPHAWGGREIQVGRIGILAYKGRPIVVTRPGNYWNWSWTHQWVGKNLDLTTVNETNGLTFAQVGQSEAMVCLDPSNQVFIVRNGGFAAYGSSGTYKVVEIVDTLNLGDQYAIREPDADNDGPSRVLGYKKEIRHRVNVSGSQKEVTIATFFNVPAQNTVVVQNGGHLKALGAGQHVITNPRCTFRGFFTYGERQRSFRTQPAYTLEGVPVVLHVNLRYRVVNALELTKSYETAFQALRNPAQSAVNAVVSRLSYQQFMRAKNIGGDIPDVEHMSWLEAFKSECLRDLAEHALEYGVQVLAFDVLDRRLEGKLGDDLEKQAESVLKNQMQSTQIALQNKINTETEQGRLEVANVKAKQVEVDANANYFKTSKEADARYYQQLKEADAEAEKRRRIAQAEADSNKIETEQKVRATEQLAEAEQKRIKLEGEGYAAVNSEHGQRIQLEKIEREKFASLPQHATVFVNQPDGEGVVTNGYQFAQGMSLGGVAAKKPVR
jgi:regulator of protease activity HflC (stomatin/prohibitin superfamily)